MSLTILDYGGGNLKSVTNMLDALGYSYEVTNTKEGLLKAEKIIFPGQGHFGQAMKELNSRDLTKALKDAVKAGVPFLGICVGLQVLFEESEEAPDVAGLGLVKGKVVKFKQGKVPQIGWNNLSTTKNNSILIDDYYYFVNSYYVKPENTETVSAYCNYGTKFAASIETSNIIAVQFHPEKSGRIGYDSIQRWLDMNK